MLQANMTDEALWAALPSLNAEELASLPCHVAAKERHILKILDRRDLTADFLKEIAHNTRWAKSPRIKFKLVNHSNTPLGDAMNMTKFLFWRELNLTLQNFRLRSEIRHVAESVLLKRLPAMAVGERVALARVAAGQILKMLRTQKEPRIIQALLTNQRLVEDDVLFLVNRQSTPAPALEAVARDFKWSSRREVRSALLRNPKAPLAVVVGFISSLTSVEALALLKDPKVPQAVRRLVRKRLGNAP